MHIDVYNFGEIGITIIRNCGIDGDNTHLRCPCYSRVSIPPTCFSIYPLSRVLQPSQVRTHLLYFHLQSVTSRNSMLAVISNLTFTTWYLPGFSRRETFLISSHFFSAISIPSRTSTCYPTFLYLLIHTYIPENLNTHTGPPSLSLFVFPLDSVSESPYPNFSLLRPLPYSDFSSYTHLPPVPKSKPQTYLPINPQTHNNPT